MCRKHIFTTVMIKNLIFMCFHIEVFVSFLVCGGGGGKRFSFIKFGENLQI
jgi:hypothetical protein